jgi:hypothetical protein
MEEIRHMVLQVTAAGRSLGVVAKAVIVLARGRREAKLAVHSLCLESKAQQIRS